MSETTFTKEQLDQAVADAIITEKQKWDEEILKPIKDELTALRPQEKTDAEKQLEAREAALWQMQIQLTLKESKLEDFVPFITAKNEDELKSQITKLNEILKVRKIDNAFVPDNHKQTNDKYAQYEKTGNVVGMIGAKLEKLFQ